MFRQILEDEEQPARVPGWALTYIDLLWLLLLFFILNSAVSEIGNGDRYRAIAAALKKRFGSEAQANQGVVTRDAKSPTAAKDRTQYDEVVREGIDKRAAARSRSLTARGVIYFPEEELQLGSEQKQILQGVAQQIGHGQEIIELRGDEAAATTAPKGANAAVPDKAYVRCIATRDYLVKLGIEPRRLRIALGGERRPQGEKSRVRVFSVTEIAEKPGNPAVFR